MFLISIATSGQEVVVSLPSSCVLYRGVENPISMAIERYPCSKIVVSASSGNLERKSDCHFIFRDTSSAKEVHIKVGIPSGDTIKWLTTHQFRQRNIPCPKITIADHWSGMLHKEVLLQDPWLQLTYSDMLYLPDTNQCIKFWSVKVLRNDTTHFSLTSIEGNKFPNELIRCLETSQSGDVYVFSDFILCVPRPQCKYPDTIRFMIL